MICRCTPGENGSRRYQQQLSGANACCCWYVGRQGGQMCGRYLPPSSPAFVPSALSIMCSAAAKAGLLHTVIRTLLNDATAIMTAARGAATRASVGPSSRAPRASRAHAPMPARSFDDAVQMASAPRGGVGADARLAPERLLPQRRVLLGLLGASLARPCLAAGVVSGRSFRKRATIPLATC